jgi:hypothetical protein
MSFGSDDAIQIGQAEVPLLAATGGLFLIGLWRSIRLRSILDPIFLLMALVVACYGPLALVFPKDLFRLLAIPAVFLAAVLINPRRDPALGAEP